MATKKLAVILVVWPVLCSCRASPTLTSDPVALSDRPFEVRWTAQEAVDAFAEAGLPFAGAHALDTGDESWDAESAIAFELPDVRTPSPDWPAPEVSVFAFDDEQAFWHRLSSAHMNRNYLPSGWDTRRTPIGFGWGWVFTRDNLVVDISSDVPRERALEYERALELLK